MQAAPTVLASVSVSVNALCAPPPAGLLGLQALLRNYGGRSMSVVVQGAVDPPATIRMLLGDYVARPTRARM